MAKELVVGLRAEARAAPAARAGWLLPALVGFFFLTGISGLIYQVLWLRMLALVFGVTIWAASTVLASFMAGLALGSFGAGRLVDRARNPLRWYGVAELLVGLSALASPQLLAACERLYVALYPALPPALGPLTLVRFLLSFVVLLVPTTLMGATLPIIVKSALLRAEGLGERVSLLYATNTAGAIAGTLLAGFVLIGGLGVDASFHLAAALNVLVGAAAIGVSRCWVMGDGGWEAPVRQHPPLPEPSPQPPTPITPPASGYPPSPITQRARRAVLLVFGLSGFASLALEVIWFRILLLFLDVTTYAFTVMLATFLAGIALGSYLVAPLMRRRLDWLAILAALELLIGIVSVLSLTALAHAWQLIGWLEAALHRSFDGALAPLAIVSFLGVFPSTLLMGIAFPVGLSLWTGEGAAAAERTGERIGVFYSLNVFGAILGSLVAGFLLLPGLGSLTSLVLIAAIGVAAGVLLLWTKDQGPRTDDRGAHASHSRREYSLVLRPWSLVIAPRSLVGVAGVVLFAAVAFAAPNPFAAVLAHRHPGERLLWREEGIQTTVSVHQAADGMRILYLDALHQANDSEPMVYLHSLIGHLPMMLHPAPRDALVIGLGGGVTAGAVSKHPGVELDVVELSGSVVRGAEWFRHVNRDVLAQPSAHLRVDDGRNFLLLTPKRYDVITADIIQPYYAGAGNLYSAEYFRLARNALKDDGLMLQWIGPLPETQYKLIMRTFLSVFPDATLWYEGSLMVGSKRPLQLDPADFERKLQDSRNRAILEEMHIQVPDGVPPLLALFSMYWAGPEELRAYVGRGPLLTDDRPLVEYFRSLPRDEPVRDVSNVRGDALRLVKP